MEVLQKFHIPYMATRHTCYVTVFFICYMTISLSIIKVLQTKINFASGVISGKTRWSEEEISTAELMSFIEVR